MNSDFRKTVRSGLFWMGLFKTIGQIFIWASTIIIARFLDPSDYGLVGMAALITSLVALIGDFGLGSSIVQKKEIEDAHVHSLFWISFGTGLFIFILLYFTAPLAGFFFKNKEVIPILRYSALALFFTVISDIPMKLLLRELRYKSLGATEFVSNLSASLCVLVMAIKGFGAYSLVWGSILTGVLKFTMACFQGPWFPKPLFKSKGLKEFMSFGGNIVASRILWYIYSNADYAILSKKLGAGPFGLYSFAFNFASIPTNKLQPILQPVFFSAFSTIQDDLPQLRREYLKIVNILFTVYAMIYCGFFWICPEFVSLILGSKWLPIIPVLQILLVIQPLRAISSGSPPIALVVGRPDIAVKTMLMFIGIMVPSFLYASAWGMTGVAIAWCAMYPLAFIIYFFMNMRVVDIPLNLFLRQLIPGMKFIVITSIVIGLFKYYFPMLFNFEHKSMELWILLAGSVLLGIISNAAVLWFFERRYIEQVKSFLKK